MSWTVELTRRPKLDDFCEGHFPGRSAINGGLAFIEEVRRKGDDMALVRGGASPLSLTEVYSDD